MKNLTRFFSSQFEKLNGTIERFYLPFILMIALFFTTSCMTLGNLNFNDEAFKILTKVAYTLAFGIFTCTLAKVLYEKYFQNKINKTAIDAIALILSSIPYILLHIYGYNALLIIGLDGIVISEILFILYFSKTDSMSETFSHFLKSLLFNFFACAIIFGGVSICILAFTILIHNFKDSYKAYLIFGEFVGIVLFGTMLSSVIPTVGSKIKIPKVFNIIVSKIMVPLYVLLLSILYVYLGKILFTWTFPSGQVNWFVSFSSLLFVFFAFSLSQYKSENKAINLFLKFGGLAIIPTIAMQFVAIYIRVSNYGLTTSRYVSIILNVFALVFAIMFLLKREKSLKHALIVLTGFVLLITVTPLNIIDVPMREQSQRLKMLLSNNSMLTNDIIVPDGSISLEEKSKIIESYRYVKGNFEASNHKPAFLNKDLIDKLEKEIFGFEKSYNYNSDQRSRIDFSYDYDHIEIGNYSKLYSSFSLFTEGNKVTINPNGKTQIVEGFYEHLKNMYLKHKESGESKITTEKIEYEYDNKKLIILNVGMYYDNDQVLKISFYNNSYLLEK
ncbi:MAG: DUF4153 domain-containing protein [Oscillospiraceae bacterium]|nr:DUF4153 domain-containing protein [Oscillospiraceae bacterium]